MRNVSGFISTLNKKMGPASANRYVVEIQQSKFMQSNEGVFVNFGLHSLPDLLKDFQFLCTACQFPGRELSATECRLYGSTIKYPYVEVYSDLSMTFLCTNKAFEERKFFDAWIQSVIPVHTHDVNFMTEYSAPIDIYQIDRKGEKVYGVRILSAYPLAILQQDISYDAQPIQYVTVSMSYDHWENIDNSGHILHGYAQLDNSPLAEGGNPLLPNSPLIVPNVVDADPFHKWLF